MSRLRVCLFGRFHIECGEEIVTDSLPPKLQEMLCYLLLFRDRLHPRETLASELWPGSSTAQSKRNLRQALWQLQRSAAFGDAPRNRDVLLVDPQCIQLNPDANLWLDVKVFEQVFSHVRGVSGQTLDSGQVQALRDVVKLYRGDLLEGWFQDWCLFERERLQNIYLSMLEKLMDHCETCGEYETGLAYGARVLRCDAARERTYRRLMRLHCLAGERSAAMRQFDRCVDALRRELDVWPAARTVALYQRIRADRFIGSAELSTLRALPTTSAAPQWSKMVEHLRGLREILLDVQEQLENAIRVVEEARKNRT
jgi:DNA-binding SARP family transcriptional activator